MKINDITRAELQSSVAIALSGCERATSLIDQLLGFTRQGKFNFSTVGLRRICGETTDFLRKVIGPDFKIEFSGDNLLQADATEISDKELLVRGDPAQIQQAITNLMINAKQSMPNGGMLTFSFSSTFVKAPEHFNPHAQPGIYAVLSVSDSGTGIDPTIIDKIFEPFFTTKGESNGSGLGLAMVYGIMQRHGGWIEVQSEPGQGSTFKLLFPQISGSEVQQLVNPIESSNTNSGSILVIDDEPFLVDLAKKFLEMSGFRANGFCNAPEAVEWFSAHYSEIDLVIMDMKMPTMDGTSCFEKLRAIDPSVRVVVLSGYLQDDSVHSLLQEGAVKFFQKPLKYPDLVRWISEYLGNKTQIAQH